MKKFLTLIFIFGLIPLVSLNARDIEYANTEVSVYVTPGEPTQIEFQDKVKGGFKPGISQLELQKRDSNLILFAKEGLKTEGEAIIVTLQNGRSFSIRVKPSDEVNKRDAVIKLKASSDLSDAYQEPEDKPFQRKVFGVAPTNSVSGFMREMALVVEFGKDKIAGYRVSTQHSGEVILNDGSMLVTIDKIFIGSDLWGYVLNAQNMLDTTQQVNPATFRVDGTRAVMAQRWELAPRPDNIEQQISGRDRAKVYVVTRAK